MTLMCQHCERNKDTEVRLWEWLVLRLSTCLNRFPQGPKHSALPPLHLTRDKHSNKTSPAVNLSLPMESLKHMKVSGCNRPSLKRRNHCLGGEQRKKAGSPDSIREARAIKEQHREERQTCSSYTQHACMAGVLTVWARIKSYYEISFF